MLVSHDEDPRLGENALEKMIAVSPSFLKLFRAKDLRVDLAANSTCYSAEALCQLAHSYLSDDKQIDVAVGVLVAACDGAKDERDPDAFLFPQGLVQQIGQATGLQDEPADLRIERVILARGVISAIAIHARFHQTEPGQAVQFLADRPDCETRLPLQFTQMKRLPVQPEEQPKNLRLYPR